jgi:hypothetical protein
MCIDAQTIARLSYEIEATMTIRQWIIVRVGWEE